MKIEIKHSGEVRNGVKYYDNPDLYRQQLQELEGKRFVEIIKEKHKSPSTSQYGLYRGGILPICYTTEMFSYFDNKDDIHSNYFAPKFLSYKTIVKVKVKDTEERYEITKVRSLTELSEKEFALFVEKVINECGILGIEIPDTNQYYNKYYR